MRALISRKAGPSRVLRQDRGLGRGMAFHEITCLQMNVADIRGAKHAGEFDHKNRHDGMRPQIGIRFNHQYLVFCTPPIEDGTR